MVNFNKIKTHYITNLCRLQIWYQKQHLIAHLFCNSNFLMMGHIIISQIFETNVINNYLIILAPGVQNQNLQADFWHSGSWFGIEAWEKNPLWVTWENEVFQNGRFSDQVNNWKSCKHAILTTNELVFTNFDMGNLFLLSILKSNMAVTPKFKMAAIVKLFFAYFWYNLI